MKEICHNRSYTDHFIHPKFPEGISAETQSRLGVGSDWGGGGREQRDQAVMPKGHGFPSRAMRMF